MDRSGPSFPAPRRVMTAPQTVLSSASTSSSSQSAADLVETLYNHPNVKIIAFTASGRARARSPGRGPAEEEPGTLAWSSQLERTIAVGPFRIYRAPGSVAFLNCGSALQPILPRSQCWCIDEASSKFILQIRRPNYWRIEVPVGDSHERHLSQALRRVLDQILQFEKTPCPFKRPFSVPLPEKPNVPVKKRPWTPVRRSLPPVSIPVPDTSPPHKAKTYGPLGKPSRLRQPREQDDGKTLEERPAPPLQEEHVPQVVEPKGATSQPMPEEDKTIAQAAGQRERQQPEVPADDYECPASDKPEGADATAVAVGVSDPGSISVTQGEAVETAKPDICDAGAASELPEIPSVEVDRSSGAKMTIPEPSTFSPDNADSLSLAESRTNPAEPTMTKPAPATYVDSSPPAPAPAPAMEFTRNDPPSTAVEGQQPAQTREAASAPLLKRPPKKADIYNVIRSYENNSAAGTSTSLDTGSATMSTTESSRNTAATAVGERTSDHEADSSVDVVEQKDHENTAEVLEGSGIVGARRKKLRGFRGGRSVTVPPQLTLITSPPSKSAVSQPQPTQLPSPSPVSEEDAQDPVSPAGSSDSFHSVKSWHSADMPLPDSPPPSQPVTPSTFPYPHDNIPISKDMSNYRDISDLTATPDAKRFFWDIASRGSNESSRESAATAPDMVPDEPADDDDALKCPVSEDEAVSTATGAAARRPHLRHRATASSISVSRRALSPLPPAANLFSPTSSSSPSTSRLGRRQARGRLELVRQLPMAIVAKTCEILLSPPSHLINLMLRVAARIAAGEWRGMVFGYGDGGEEIPVQWDYSDDELSDWDGEGDGGEYHYMDQVERSLRVDGGATGRSWEVD